MKVIVPTELSEIKISQYQKFVRATKDIEDSHIYDRMMVGCFCGLSDKEIDSLPFSDFIDIVNILKETIAKEPKGLQTIIKHDGRELGFIPDGFENITVGELADIDSFFKDVSTYDKAMAVLYRPILSRVKNKYAIEKYKGEGQSLDLSLEIVFSTLVFFSSLIIDLLTSTLNYIEEEAHQTNLTQTLEKNGVGINHFTDLQMETFLNLKRSQN